MNSRQLHADTAINVAFVTTELGPGGAEIMLCRLVSRLDRQRFNPSIIVLKAKDRRITPRIEAEGIPVHSLGLRKGRPTLRGLVRLRRLMSQIQPQIVQGWMYHGNVAAALGTVGMKGASVYWSIHHSLYSLAEERRSTRAVIALSKLLASRASAIAYVSAASARHHEQYGFPSRLTVLTPNGFDAERFRPRGDWREEVRRELGIESSDVVIGSLSRYIPLKDHASFLAAAGQLVRKHPQALFLLLGHDIEQSNAELMAAIRKHALQSRIRLLGHRPDTHRILSAMDIMTNHSYSEAFPLAVGEAMASGLPCVATDVGDTALLIGDAGVLVPPRSPGALANAWSELIEAGEQSRRALGARARERVLGQFSLKASVQRYETLYAQGPAPLFAFGESA